jgi:hypothetical protein
MPEEAHKEGGESNNGDIHGKAQDRDLANQDFRVRTVPSDYRHSALWGNSAVSFAIINETVH